MLQHWASEMNGSDIITEREKVRKDQLEVGDKGTTSFFGIWMTHQQKQTKESCGRCEGRKRGKRQKKEEKEEKEEIKEERRAEKPEERK